MYIATYVCRACICLYWDLDMILLLVLNSIVSSLKLLSLLLHKCHQGSRKSCLQYLNNIDKCMAT